MNSYKILMISINDLGSTASLGVTKKILGQYKAFQNLGCDVYNLCLDDGAGVLIHKTEKTVLFGKQVKTYLAYIKLFGKADKICKENQIELCYIRYPMADWVFCRMAKRLHRICKVYVEIPTFPYDYDTKKETNIVAKFDYWQDLRNRNKIGKYIDLMINYHGHEEIYGVKALPIDNGIDVDSVNYIGDNVSFDGDINLIGVALLIDIHGYDRIIEGLRNYYVLGNTARNVNFYIVGDGPVAPRLKELVREYQLEDHVFFTGVKAGKELDDIFRRANIAVASLAAHRRGGKMTSELKVKEYCARGIPFIATSRDRTIPEEAEFVKIMPANDEPIDILSVIRFADRCNEIDGICSKIRRFAEENCIWEEQLQKIFM